MRWSAIHSVIGRSHGNRSNVAVQPFTPGSTGRPATCCGDDDGTAMAVPQGMSRVGLRASNGLVAAEILESETERPVGSPPTEESPRQTRETPWGSRDPRTPGYEHASHHWERSVRNPVTDHLLTPENSALVVIDYQPSQVQTVASMDQRATRRQHRVGRSTREDIRPSRRVVHRQGRERSGADDPRAQGGPLDSAEIDRTEINSWENADFRRAVEATGRKKLIMTALWTEVCLAFPTLDAIREGFEVYPGGRRRREVRRPKLTVPGSSEWSRPAHSPSAGYRWPASSSGTGPASTPLRTSSTSC